MDIALIVFDIAGTTVKDDNKVGDAFRATLQHFGYDIPLEQINPYMGYEKNKAIKEILKTYQNGNVTMDDAQISAIHRSFVGRMIRYYETSEEIEALPNVEETFAVLRQQGVKIAINTGFSRNIADVIVEKLGWYERQLIDYLIASDEVLRGRPYPDMIQQLMAKTGITDPLQVAKVGDTEVDINEGKNAGCQYVIGVTTGAYTREELEKYDPTHIIDDIREVVGIIEK
ncbi:HAD-IA family hydrolase [Parapedobacter sp. ISTM3]|uniref:Phosphonatase-like hydrolase n=1 Tax=Parapedobacter luteus TaxID=623280 RepID=A0A1T4ZZU2_9SPHI|nr:MULTISPECIES: HAD-IA family hydrolase [Parapedobacter]MBK1438842.1 HAD-IA family hydrolase [Parapedobacter sp. ISTM3]SKB28196.1 phosphonatase-like hydrolase [Parapedobacter luteus]